MIVGDTKLCHYHSSLANPHDASILSADYQCAGYYVDPNDSIDEAATDSIIDGENTNTPDTNPMEQDSENSSDE